MQNNSPISLKISDLYMLWAKGLNYAKLQKAYGLAFLEPNYLP